MRLGRNTQDRMILAIIGLDIAHQTHIVLIELGIRRSHRRREVVSTQIDNRHSRAEGTSSCIPACGRIAIKRILIDIGHYLPRYIRACIARDTTTRVSNSKIIRIEIASYNTSIGTRSVLGLILEWIATRRSINTISTGIAIADKLNLASLERFSLKELAIGDKLLNRSSTTVSLGTALEDHLMLFEARFLGIRQCDQINDGIIAFYLDDMSRFGRGRSIKPNGIEVALGIGKANRQRLARESNTEIGRWEIKTIGSIFYNGATNESDASVGSWNGLSLKAKRR